MIASTGATAAAVEVVYKERREPLLRLAFVLLGSQADAEDAVQAAFASLLQAKDDVANPAAYLRQAVINRANDHHRRSFRAVPAPAEAVLGEPVLDETWQSVNRLPGTQRLVVALRYYEDLPLADIARLLGRPESTVRSDLRRALIRLREELAHD